MDLSKKQGEKGNNIWLEHHKWEEKEEEKGDACLSLLQPSLTLVL